MTNIRPAVVVGEHTLGVIIGNEIQVLHASPLRGAVNCGPLVGLISIPTDPTQIRLATRKDFVDYNVQWHPDYTPNEANLMGFCKVQFKDGSTEMLLVTYYTGACLTGDPTVYCNRDGNTVWLKPCDLPGIRFQEF